MNREKIEPVAFNSWFSRMFGGVQTSAANAGSGAPTPRADRPNLAPSVDRGQNQSWIAPGRPHSDHAARTRALGAV